METERTNQEIRFPKQVHLSIEGHDRHQMINPENNFNFEDTTVQPGQEQPWYKRLYNNIRPSFSIISLVGAIPRVVLSSLALRKPPSETQMGVGGLITLIIIFSFIIIWAIFAIIN